MIPKRRQRRPKHERLRERRSGELSPIDDAAVEDLAALVAIPPKAERGLKKFRAHACRFGNDRER
jgi:hypothetical protein